jgi:hypothetical protein
MVLVMMTSRRFAAAKASSARRPTSASRPIVALEVLERGPIAQPGPQAGNHVRDLVERLGPMYEELSRTRCQRASGSLPDPTRRARDQNRPAGEVHAFHRNPLAASTQAQGVEVEAGIN